MQASGSASVPPCTTTASKCSWNATRRETVATLDAKLDSAGHITSMPIVYFTQRGGYHLETGDEVKTTATYSNPTGHDLPDGAMGIAVGYFLPDDDSQFSQLHHASTHADR